MVKGCVTEYLNNPLIFLIDDNIQITENVNYSCENSVQGRINKSIEVFGYNIFNMPILFGTSIDSIPSSLNWLKITGLESRFYTDTNPAGLIGNTGTKNLYINRSFSIRFWLFANNNNNAGPNGILTKITNGNEESGEYRIPIFRSGVIKDANTLSDFDKYSVGNIILYKDSIKLRVWSTYTDTNVGDISITNYRLVDISTSVSSITVESFTGGTASADKSTAEAGDTVTVTINMDNNYAVDRDTTYVLAGIEGIEKTWIDDNHFTFVMPDLDVIVRIGSTQLTAYNITKKSQGYGTFTTSPANSQYETKPVTITTVPEAGYRVKYVTVSNPASGTEYTVTNVSTNNYRFTMPSSDVLVSVKFWDGDPYSPGDQDDGTGGDGDFDGNSDKIPLDPTPAITIADSGMISLFNPTADEVKSFGNFLWSALLDLDTIKRILSDPIDNIISLHMLPIQINHASDRDNVKFAGIPTGVQMRRVTTQYHNIDMGSMDITKYYDSALDYSPYTTIKIFLPYIGEVELNTDEIMGKTINLRYRVDALSGKCIAFILVNNDVLYQFPGQMSMFIPLSAANYGRIIGAGAGLAGVLIGGLAGGVAGLAAGFMASGKKTAVEGLEQSISASYISPMEHGIVGSAGYNAAAQKRAYLLAEAKGKMLSGAADYQTGRAINLAAQATQKYAPVVGGVASVMGAKRISTHTGSIVSDAGFMGIQHPYLIIRRPNQSLAENYNHFMGYPANKYVKVGDCSGYNEFIRLELKGIPATDSELAEIDELLKGGVYL